MAEQTILAWLLIGIVAGLLGRVLLPGRDPGGFAVLALIGIAGALLAGFAARSSGLMLAGGLEGFWAPIMGAAVLIAAYRLTVRSRVG